LARNARKETDQARVELGALLGSRYRVLNHLGTGGAGIVFGVRDAATGVDRVAKLLRVEVRTNVALKADFVSEAKKLAGLRHKNLVTVYEQSPEVSFYNLRRP
jgi:serine/threonine protein kinase